MKQHWRREKWWGIGWLYPNSWSVIMLVMEMFQRTKLGLALEAAEQSPFRWLLVYLLAWVTLPSWIRSPLPWASFSWSWRGSSFSSESRDSSFLCGRFLLVNRGGGANKCLFSFGERYIVHSKRKGKASGQLSDTCCAVFVIHIHDIRHGELISTYACCVFILFTSVSLPLPLVSSHPQILPPHRHTVYLPISHLLFLFCSSNYACCGFII